MNRCLAILFVIALLAAEHPLLAQAPTPTRENGESSGLKDVLLFGWKLPASGPRDVPADLQAAIASYRQRQDRFHSRLTPPAEKNRVYQVSFEKRRAFERTIFSLFDAPDIVEIAADFAGSARFLYEWEGFPESPLEEATGAEGYLKRHPGTPIAPYLHLFIAHRQLCAASLSKFPEERDTAMARFRADMEIAKRATQPLIRFQAFDLDLHPRCYDK